MSTLLKKLSLTALLVTPTLLLPTTVNADEGFFIQGGYNYGSVDDGIDVDFSDVDDVKAYIDDSSGGYNIGAGYRFNNWLSVDAAYWDLGSFSSGKFSNGDRIDLDTTAYTLGGMASVPLWIFDVYARGGVAMWDVDARQVGDDGTDPYYGAGVALNIFSSLDLYAEAVRFDLESDVDTFSLGVRFTF